ncbi:type II secretion system protein [Cerasicoccus frondis]|uniref:type II secretion system protein n=1 Tax=Cerasicoccus frondis TaxID=490090 RepID=UPI002852D56F|nr:type II secretion system protein [Cerasicoccus frondis]
MNKRNIHHSRAFTLVELLVCIAILIVLGAITIPAISGVRARAKIAASSSNLRQLGQAANLYRIDNNNRMLPLGEYDPQNEVMKEWCFSFRFDHISFSNGNLAPYLDNVEEVLRCPVWEPSEAYQQTNLMYPNFMGYGFNALNTGERLEPEESVSGSDGEWIGYHYSRVLKPSETVLFTTAANKLNTEAVPPTQGMIWPPDHNTQPCVRLVNSHEAIVCMMDGSVRMMNATTELQTSSDGVRLGYLDKDMDGNGDLDIWYPSPELHIVGK